GYTLRAVFRTELTRHLKLETGFDFEGSRNPVSLTVPVGSSGEGGGGGGGGGGGDDEVGGSGAPAIASDAATLYSTSASPFAALTISALRNRLTIAPQIRLETFAFSAYAGTPDAFSHGFVKVEPRVIVRYQLLRWLAAKAAFGYYHQPPELMSFSRTFGNPNVGLESGLHYVAGFDLKPTSTLRIEAQGFSKDLRDLVVRGANAGDPLAQNADRGRVYGGDLLVRQELSRNFFGWIAYTLSRSERKDHPDEPWRLFRFDQTHILTAVGSYKLPRGYQVGLRFRLVSGNPYTPVVGSYYDAGALRFRPLSGDPFSARLKLFHQLDLRFDKTWTFNRWRFSVYLDIQNLYYSTSQEGIAYNFDYTKSAPVSGLPLLPIFGVRGDF
ncbi:MAG: TonB-dependent receptor, partial [Deltaproteobacteria bacterium]|nr:TonB-dependent receptor [Deltaproteobacteria bacterium]